MKNPKDIMKERIENVLKKNFPPEPYPVIRSATDEVMNEVLRTLRELMDLVP